MELPTEEVTNYNSNNRHNITQPELLNGFHSKRKKVLYGAPVTFTAFDKQRKSFIKTPPSFLHHFNFPTLLLRKDKLLAMYANKIQTERNNLESPSILSARRNESHRFMISKYMIEGKSLKISPKYLFKPNSEKNGIFHTKRTPTSVKMSILAENAPKYLFKNPSVTNTVRISKRSSTSKPNEINKPNPLCKNNNEHLEKRLSKPKEESINLEYTSKQKESVLENISKKNNIKNYIGNNKKRGINTALTVVINDEVKFKEKKNSKNDIKVSEIAEKEIINKERKKNIKTKIKLKSRKVLTANKKKQEEDPFITDRLRQKSIPFFLPNDYDYTVFHTYYIVHNNIRE